MRQGEDQGIHDEVMLEERGRGDENADPDRSGRSRPHRPARHQGECPDEQGIDERLGVRLIRFESKIGRRDDPERGGPFAAPAPGACRPCRVDSQHREKRRDDVQQVDRPRAAADHRLRDVMRDVQTWRLVLPEVGVEPLPLVELPRDHRRRGDVALEGLVVGVKSCDQDRAGEDREDEDREATPSREPGNRRVGCGLERAYRRMSHAVGRRS